MVRDGRDDEEDDDDVDIVEDIDAVGRVEDTRGPPDMMSSMVVMTELWARDAEKTDLSWKRNSSWRLMDARKISELGELLRRTC